MWCDHSDPNLLKPFEDANGVKVNVKEFEGTGAGLAIIEQSQPGDWDVMVIDSIDVRRGVDRGLFAELPEDQLPFADLFPEVRMDGMTKFDGKRYGITEKFGYNTIGFNKAKVDAADMQSLSVLTNDKYKGRVAIYDYYLPVIGLAATILLLNLVAPSTNDVRVINYVVQVVPRVTGRVIAGCAAAARCVA